MIERRICVVGLGYVGLPLACILAKKRFSVLGIDADGKKIKDVSKGVVPFKEKGLDKLLKEVISEKKLAVTSDYSKMKNWNKFIICVPTPVDERGEANLNYIYSACNDLAKFLKKEDLVVIESSVPPGTVENIAKKLGKESNLRAGKDFYLAHCPERIFPGNVLYEIQNNDRIVAGFDKKSGEMTAKIYKSFTKGKILMTSLATAQLVKLVENVFRDVNIALANELALICEKLGLDVKEVIELANTHPRVKYLNPGCGVGGTCIPKDPELVSNLCKEMGFDTRLIRVARDVNNFMEEHFSKKVTENIKGKDVLVLGVAYKGDVGDARYSPAEKIINYFKKAGLNVSVYDPWVEKFDGVDMLRSLDGLKRKFDAIVLITDHTEFKEMDLKVLKKVAKDDTIVFDGRRVLDKKKIEGLGLKYMGIGI